MPLSPVQQTVIENGNTLFNDRSGLLLMWQEMAENFYYDRAQFTGSTVLGQEYAIQATASDGALYRREMANLFQPMMRPSDFFEVKAADDDRNKNSEARGWLQDATVLMRKVMYATAAQLSRSSSLTDHDYVTFGQGAIEVCPRKDRRGLYYRNWHLRDVAWSQDYAGAVGDVHRNETTTLRNLVVTFGDKVPEKLRRDASARPFDKVKARHVVVPSTAYDLGIPVRSDRPFTSLWVLPDHGEVLQILPRQFKGYVIPRALTPDGSQYASSPFTSIVIADGRTAQVIERILLEAGEKAVDPPMVGTVDAIRGDIGLYAGGITWVDAEYDEKLGEAIRPLNIDTSGLAYGDRMSDRFAMRQRLGFMLDKVSLPETSGKTAYEVRKIVEQQMRQQIPIFGPIEAEYSEPLCSETFLVMRSLGAFPAQEIPDALRGENVDFTFKSPLADLEADALKAKLVEGMEVLGAAGQLDPQVSQIADPMAISRDMLQRLGWPEDWMRDEKRLAAAIEEMQAQRQAERAAADAGGAAEAAGKAAPMVAALMGAKKAA